MRSMMLWVDDERPEPLGWVRCSTAENAIRFLDGGGVDCVSLDHDLGGGLTGYYVASWLEAQAVGGRWCVVPEFIFCHSANPVGRGRIEACIRSISKMRGK